MVYAFLRRGYTSFLSPWIPCFLVVYGVLFVTPWVPFVMLFRIACLLMANSVLFDTMCGIARLLIVYGVLYVIF